MLPPRIWKNMEGGLIESFGMEGKSVVMVSGDKQPNYDKDVVMQVVVEKFVKYFTMVLHHCQKYFAIFVTMEVANVLLLFFNFWATDQFLQGRFKHYGTHVRTHTVSSPRQKWYLVQGVHTSGGTEQKRLSVHPIF